MTRSAAASSSSGVTPGASSRRASARAAAVARPALQHGAELGRRLVERATEHAGQAQAAPWTGWAGTRPRDASASKMRAVTSSSVPTPSMGTTSPRLAVHVEDRRRLALVDREAVGDDLFGVVGAALVDRPLAEPRDALLARHAELDARRRAPRRATRGSRRGRRPGPGCGGTRRAGSRPRHPAARGGRARARRSARRGRGRPPRRSPARARPARCRRRCSRGTRRRWTTAGTSKASATSTPCVPLPDPCGPTIRKRAEPLAGAVIGGALRSVAAAAGRRSASPSRGRRRR